MDEITPERVWAHIVTHKTRGSRKASERWHWVVDVDQGLSLRGDGDDLGGFDTKEQAEAAGREKVKQFLTFIGSAHSGEVK